MSKYEDDDELEKEAETSPDSEESPSISKEDLQDQEPPEAGSDKDIESELQDEKDIGQEELNKKELPEEIASESDKLGQDLNSENLSAENDVKAEDLQNQPKEEAEKPKLTGNPQIDKYQNFLDEYKRLQDQRSKSNLVTGLIAAGGKIGQSMAGKYSGNFNPDMSGVKMLQGMADRPVQDFEQRQVVQSRGLQLKQAMESADPSSPQSSMVRNYLNQRLGLNLGPDVSAADAQMLLKTVGRPVQTKFQKVNGTYTDPESGEAKRMSAIFDPSTGTYKDATSGKALPGFLAEGLNPFQTTINPNTGEREVFNKSRGTAPAPLGNKPEVGQARTPNEVYVSLSPNDRKELNDKIIPNFNKLTEKTQQRLMHQAPIQAKLEEAQINPAAYAQLQAELARFDVGDQRLAQQEFNMFATRHGYKGWGDWVQKNSTGTISPDFAQDFAHTINNTVKGMQEDLNNQAEKQANLLISRLPPGQKVDAKNIAPLIYSGYKPSAKSSNKQVIKKGYNSKTNQTQLIYEDGSKEIVDGQQ